MLLLYTGVFIMIQISSRLGRQGCCYSTLGYSLLFRHLVGWGDRDVVTLHWGIHYDTDI